MCCPGGPTEMMDGSGGARHGGYSASVHWPLRGPLLYVRQVIMPCVAGFFFFFFF